MYDLKCVVHRVILLESKNEIKYMLIFFFFVKNAHFYQNYENHLAVEGGGTCMHFGKFH